MVQHTPLPKPVVIVGAGMAGLSCAVHLWRSGVPVRVIEADSAVGGRVQTDCVDGFLLDRGFQVYLDAYPESGRLLDLDALDLRAFEPGALVFRDGRLHRLMDVFRRPGAVVSALRAPVGSLADKARVGLLRTKLAATSLESIDGWEDQSTEAFLRGFGFSSAMIDCFFRTFYGGVFLERELRTSSRMFAYTFKLFAKGSATLPAKGMGEIPRQLARRLPPEAIRLSTRVVAVDASGVTLDDGTRVDAERVVVATDGSTASRWFPQMKPKAPVWRSVMNLYFAAAASPLGEPIICLNGEGTGVVNNVCVLTDAAPQYSADGRALISVSVLGLAAPSGLEEAARRELRAWFGAEVDGWELLRIDRIPQALPEQLPGVSAGLGFQRCDGAYICGDHCTSASIEGAVTSGKKVAESLREELALKSV